MRLLFLYLFILGVKLPCFSNCLLELPWVARLPVGSTHYLLGSCCCTEDCLAHSGEGREQTRLEADTENLGRSPCLTDSDSNFGWSSTDAFIMNFAYGRYPECVKMRPLHRFYDCCRSQITSGQ